MCYPIKRYSVGLSAMLLLVIASCHSAKTMTAEAGSDKEAQTFAAPAAERKALLKDDSRSVSPQPLHQKK